MTAANLYGSSKQPEWFKLCHFSQDFTDDLSPGGVDKLLEKMAENPELLRKVSFQIVNLFIVSNC